MKLAIYDYGSGGFTAVARSSAVAALSPETVPVFDPPVEKAAETLRRFSHIVCHLSSRKEDMASWQNLIGGNLSDVSVIIRVSSQGASGMSDSFKRPYRLTRSGPWVLHLKERSSDVTKERWTKVFNALKVWDPTKPDLPIDIAVIFDPTPEARLALQLLCDAWLINKGVAAVVHNGVTINAPILPQDWFAPFVEENEPAIEPSQTAAITISNQMGTAKRVTEDFLKEVAGLWDQTQRVPRGNVTESHFEKGVTDLRNALKSATF